MRSIRIQILALFAVIFLFAGAGDAFGQLRIRHIYLDRRDVFDTSQADWFAGAEYLNRLHIQTRPFIVEDEILFEEGDEPDFDRLRETERNLRSIGVFTDASVEIDTINENEADVYVTTYEKWSTNPGIIWSKEGDVTEFGAQLNELNLLGYATRLSLRAVNTTRNETGWQGEISLFQRRLFRSELNLGLNIGSDRYATRQGISLTHPFRTLATPMAFSLSLNNSFGNDFLFENNRRTVLPYRQYGGGLWYSQRIWRGDQLFVTGLADLRKAERPGGYRLAGDNSARFLVGFSSLKQDFRKVKMLNSYQTEDLVIGGWGTAVLGRFFPAGDRGDGMYYVGAQGERSWLLNDDDLYIFGRLTGGSGFQGSRGRYTYQEFLGKSFYRFTKNFLLSANIRQQTAWNWDSAFRQLVLDNGAGLRGYTSNSLAGQNRAVTSFEARYFSDWELWILRFSGALFYDTGTVWNQGTDLMKTRFHHTVGAGLRIHNTKGGAVMLVVDVPYNLDEKRISGITISGSYPFSVFENHNFRIPEFFGEAIDLQ